MEYVILLTGSVCMVGGVFHKIGAHKNISLAQTGKITGKPAIY